MSIRFLNAVLFAVAAVCTASCAQLVLVGDSTLAPRAPADPKSGSWGDALTNRLASGHAVLNRAVGGRTVLTTLPTWPKTLAAIRKDDFVIVQFGINDASKRKLVTPEAFKETLARFADDIRAKGATPVFCSPIPNSGHGEHDAPDAPYRLTPARRAYGDCAKEVAAAKKIDFVDMTALVAAWLEKEGTVAAQACYRGESTRDGKRVFDTTHPNKVGAARFAEIFLKDVKARNLPVATLFK